MASKQQLLNICSLVLLFRGTNLFCRSRASRFLRLCLRLLYPCVHLVYSYVFWQEMIRSDETHFPLNPFLFLLTSLVSTFNLMRNTERLEALIVYLIQNLNQSNTRNVVRHVCFYFAVYFLQVFIFITNQVTDHEPKKELEHVILQVVYNFVAEWILTTSIFYATLLHMLSYVLDSKTKRILAWQRMLHFNPDIVTTTTASIKSLIIEFEQLLSIQPFLWFLYGIAGSAGIVFDVIAKPESVMNVVFAAQDYLPPILVVLWAAKIQERLCDDADRVIQTLVTAKAIKGSERIILIMELESLKKAKLTGLSFFTLNKEFIASYVGSVLTFAALIAGFSKR